MAFAENLDTLINELGINANKLARAIDYDPSYISRIRNGSRQPADRDFFISRVAHYSAQYTNSLDLHLKLAKLTGISPEEAASFEARDAAIRRFLASQTLSDPPPVDTEPLTKLLETLDSFNLDDFLESIHFDNIKVPTLPFQLPTTKTYTGIEEMKQAELDFYKAAVLSKDTRELIMYSDMPIEEMSQDKEFPKKVMMSIAVLIRKGVHIKNIHNVHRPLHELILGLEGWIPVYMTGFMESYYLPHPTNTSFLHFLRSCETVACTGEAITGDQASGRYVVSKNATDVAYAQTRAKQLLGLAKPLLHVFQENDKGRLKKKLERVQSRASESVVQIGTESGFKTLTMSLLPGHYALIEKNNAPAVSLLIEHPLLIDALEQYNPALF